MHHHHQTLKVVAEQVMLKIHRQIVIDPMQVVRLPACFQIGRLSLLAEKIYRLSAVLKRQGL